jgi:hypothetical protein
MSPSGRRRLTLKDTTILIAATAVGIAWARGGWNWMYIARVAQNTAVPESWRPFDRLVRSLPAALPCLATWTVALLVLRLNRPRPRLYRLALQPGAVATITATVGLFIGAVDFGLNTLWWWLLRNEATPWRRVAFHSMEYLFEASSRITVALIAVGTIMLLSRRFRPERSWIDRTGRIVGLLWLTLAACRGWSELANLMNDNSSGGLLPILLRSLVRSRFSP